MREREGGKKSQNKIKVGNYETKSGVIREMIRFFFIKSFFTSCFSRYSRSGIHSLGGVRVSVLDWRVAGASLIVLDLLHQDLLVRVRVSLVSRHTRRAAGVGVVTIGVSPVGAGRVARWRIAWRG